MIPLSRPMAAPVNSFPAHTKSEPLSDSAETA